MSWRYLVVFVFLLGPALGCSGDVELENNEEINFQEEDPDAEGDGDSSGESDGDGEGPGENGGDGENGGEEVLPEPPAGLTYYRLGNEPLDDAQPQGPGLLLMGGGFDVDAAFQVWLERLDGGDVVILRTSGADGYNRYLYEELGGINSVETLLVDSRELANDPYVLHRINGAAGIFMAGGDQFTYLENWSGTGVEEALGAAFERGALVGGTSAGLAVIGEFVFTAEEGTVYPDEVLEDPYNQYVTLGPGLLSWSSLEGVITDSHFRERERMGRLIGFLARLATDEEREVLGIGIDEDTALVIDGTGNGVVYGDGGVYLLRNRPGEPTRVEAGAPLSSAVDVWALRAGDVVELPGWETEVSSYVVSAQNEQLTPEEPYGDWD